MNRAGRGQPRDLVNSKRVSEVLSIPVATLAKWRQAGTGPPFYRIGVHVRYSVLEVDTWLDSKRVDCGP